MGLLDSCNGFAHGGVRGVAVGRIHFQRGQTVAQGGQFVAVLGQLRVAVGEGPLGGFCARGEGMAKISDEPLGLGELTLTTPAARSSAERR